MQTPMDNLVGALCARDHKGVGNQYVGENKLVILEQTACDVYNGAVSDVAGSLTTATGTSNGSGPKVLQSMYRMADLRLSDDCPEQEVCPTITATFHKRGDQVPMVVESVVDHTLPLHTGLIGRWRADSRLGHGIGKFGDPSFTLLAGQSHAVFQVAAPISKGNGECWENDRTFSALSTGGGQIGQGYAAVRTDMSVRRLTPIECERLQGFPDNYTQIEWRNKTAEECPDGPRYKALGNSMTVNVMRWIGERIQLVENR